MKVGKVFYGLHFAQGVAEYIDMPNDEGKPLRIFINSDTAKKMDPTFSGRPVFVHHKNEMTEDDFQEADGYVVESFFNKSDGNHWAKFIVTTKRGEDALTKGWKLSNAYFKMEQTGSGKWHGVEYDREITVGEYEHLAIVDNPRYEESEVLTPDEFKIYNSDKELELIKFSNEQKKKKPVKIKRGIGMLNIFKRERVENSLEIENTEVLLPRSGKTISIISLVENADKDEMDGKMANGDSMIKVGDKDMSVNELRDAYMKNMAESDEKKKAENEEAEKKKAENEEAEKKKAENEDDDEKKTENEDDEKKTENEDDDDKDKDKKKTTKNSVYNSLKNAESEKLVNNIQTLETSEDKIKKGVSRYGS